MLYLLWDASALVKRYVPETGSDVVAELFARTPLSCMVTTFIGYAESHAVLVRKHNRGEFSSAIYQTAISTLQGEVIKDVDFTILEVDSTAYLAGIALVERLNVNSSDAAILATFLSYADLQLKRGNSSALIAADTRLIRAAHSEGLAAINPEISSITDAVTFLSSF